MAGFEIAGVSVEAGELEFGSLPVLQMRDGSMLSIPFMVMCGAHEGPTLWVDCATHGDEIPGIEVIRRMMREEVKPDELHGTIVAVPALNIWAFREGSHMVPLTTGDVDMSAVPTDNPKGGPAERMAHRIFAGGMCKSDYVIQFHTNVYPAVEFIVFTRPDERDTLDACVALAGAIGLPMCEMAKRPGNRGIEWTCHHNRIPAIIVELLAHGYLDERSVQIGTKGLLNALRHLKMVEGEPAPLPGLKVPPGRYGRYLVYSDYGGMAHFLKHAGDWVDTNEVIAFVYTLFGDMVGEVRAPMQGYIRSVMFGPHNEAVHEGSPIASILETDPSRHYFYD